MDLDDLIATAAPRSEEVRVCLRGDLVERHISLVQQMNDEVDQPRSLGGNPEVARLASEILAVEADQEAAMVTLKVSTIGARRWANLLSKYPPTREQRRDQGADHNPQTFPPAALSACCEGLSIEQAERLYDALTTGEWNKLWMTVVGLNVVGMPVPKLAAATDLLQASVPSSTTPDPLASPEDDSLAGSGDPSQPTSTTVSDD